MIMVHKLAALGVGVGLLAAGIGLRAEAAGPSIPSVPTATIGVDSAGVSKQSDNFDLAGRVSLQAADLASAQLLAARSGKPVEVSSLGSPTRLVAVMPDGGQRQLIYAAPSRAPGADGRWSKIDLGLQARPNEGFSPKNSLVPVTFSAGGDREVMKLGFGSQWVGLKSESALPAAVVAGDYVTYPEVLPGVDVVARSMPDGAVVNFVIKDKQAAARVAREGISLAWSGSAGVSVVEKPTGVAVVSGGKPVFDFADAVMWDAQLESPVSSADAVAKQANGPMHKVDVSVAGDRLIYKPGPGLADTNVRFPVVMSHGPYNAGVQRSVSISNANLAPDANEYYVGYQGWQNPVHTWRSFFFFDWGPGIDLSQITKATMVIKQSHSPNHIPPAEREAKCGNTYFGSGVELRWSDMFDGKPAWPGSALYDLIGGDAWANGHSNDCGPHDQVFDVTRSVQQNVDKHFTGIWYGLKSADEGDRNGWRRYLASPAPYIEIHYNHRPLNPDQFEFRGVRREPLNGLFYSPNDRLNVSARVIDPNTDKSKLEVYSGGRADFSDYVASGERASVDAYIPNQGQEHAIQARTHDDNGRFSDMVNLSERFVYLPAKPKVPTIAGFSPQLTDGKLLSWQTYEMTLRLDRSGIPTYRLLWGTTDTNNEVGVDFTKCEVCEVKVKYTPTEAGPLQFKLRSISAAGVESDLGVSDSMMVNNNVLTTHRWLLDGDTKPKDGAVDLVGSQGVDISKAGVRSSIYSNDKSLDASTGQLSADNVIDLSKPFSMAGWFR